MFGGHVDELLRERLFANQFGLQLLELAIDREAFQDLCAILKEIAATWSGKDSVDKEVANFMVEQLMIMRNKLRYPDSSFDADDLAELERMHDEFQQIVLGECLA